MLAVGIIKLNSRAVEYVEIGQENQPINPFRLRLLAKVLIM
jgi:hypothetical protein